MRATLLGVTSPKLVVFLGDSISDGQIAPPPYASAPFVQRLVDDLPTQVVRRLRGAPDQLSVAASGALVEDPNTWQQFSHVMDGPTPVRDRVARILIGGNNFNNGDSAVTVESKIRAVVSALRDLGFTRIAVGCEYLRSLPELLLWRASLLDPSGDRMGADATWDTYGVFSDSDFSNPKWFPDGGHPTSLCISQRLAPPEVVALNSLLT